MISVINDMNEFEEVYLVWCNAAYYFENQGVSKQNFASIF
jgi:hypothetical protein